MEKETWKYILANGKFRRLEVKNPTFDKGALASIKGLKPIDKKDSDNKPTEALVHDPNPLLHKAVNRYRSPYRTTVLKFDRQANEQTIHRFGKIKRAATHCSKPTLFSTFAFAPTARQMEPK